MPKQTAPTPEQIKALNARAAEYGYGVDETGTIILRSGKASSCRVTFMRDVIRVCGHQLDREPILLFRGSDLGAFLVSFWHASITAPDKHQK